MVFKKITDNCIIKHYDKMDLLCVYRKNVDDVDVIDVNVNDKTIIMKRSADKIELLNSAWFSNDDVYGLEVGKISEKYDKCLFRPSKDITNSIRATKNVIMSVKQIKFLDEKYKTIVEMLI